MSAQRPRSLPHRFLVAAVVAATATTVVAVAPAALAAPKPKTSSFTATISPTTATVGDRDDVRHHPHQRHHEHQRPRVRPGGRACRLRLGHAWHQPPCRAGSSTRPRACSGDSPSGCGAPGSTLVEISTPSSGGAAKIGPGKSITFYVTATPTAKGHVHLGHRSQELGLLEHRPAAHAQRRLAGGHRVRRRDPARVRHRPAVDASWPGRPSAPPCASSTPTATSCRAPPRSRSPAPGSTAPRPSRP